MINIQSGYQKLIVGCIVRRNDSILLVKHSYGHMKGKWDFPKGHVEMGESMESAAIREIKEETSLVVKPKRIIGMRDMIMDIPDKGIVNDFMIIWLLEYESGEPIPDGRELLEAKFTLINEVYENPDIGGWTKEILTASLKGTGLQQGLYQPLHHPKFTRYWSYYMA